MERQRLYNERVVAQPGQVRGANVVGPPAGHDWADNLLKTVAGAGSDIMRVIAHDYVRNENALMQEALISADTKFESWKQDYMKEHQGQSALDAQRDFVRKYGEIRQETMDMFQGHDNEIFRERLDQSLGMRALHALQTGGAYQEQQDAAWQKSVFDGTLANFERDVQANPANEQYIAARRAEVVQDMQTRFKGEDLTARVAKLDEQIAEGRMNALLAAGDYDGAEKLLGGSGTAPAASSGGVPGSFTSSGGGTTSSRNLSVHNYGNVKNIDGKFNAYASRHDGLMAIAERIKRYHEDPKRNAQSISDIIHIYAPKEDSNDPKGYAAFLGKRLGISPTSRLNFNDPKMVAGLVQGIAAMEHGAKKVSVGDDEALAAAQAVASGQMPKVVGRAPAKGEAARTQAGTQAGTTGTSSLPGLSPEQQMIYRNKINAARKHVLEQAQKAQQAAQAQSIQGLVSSLSDIDPDQRKAAVYAQLDKITDPEQRKNALSIANREIEFQDKKQKAQRAFAVSSLVQKARAGDYTPAQQEELVLNSGLKEEDQKDALKRIRGEVKTNELNMRATAAMRRQIDEARQNGQPMDDDSIFRFYRDNMLTQSQLEELFKYRDEGGKAGHVTQSQVNNIWRDLQGEKGERKKTDDAPAELYAAVLKLLPDGHKATHDDIRKAVSQAIVKGKVSGFIWDSSYTRAEAMAKGKLDKWRANEDSKNEVSINDDDY